MKKSLLMTLIVFFLFQVSCTKGYVKEDFDKLQDKTFYLLPMSANNFVPPKFENSAMLKANLDKSVINGIKDMNVQKLKEGLEKRYGIKVDTTYFDKARKDPATSALYFEAIKNNSLNPHWTNTYTGYTDSEFYKEIEKIKKTKSYIYIFNQTLVQGDNASTSNTISIYVVKNGSIEGQAGLANTFKHGRSGDGGFFSTGVVEFTTVYNYIRNMADYKFMDTSMSFNFEETSLDGSN